jgi:hypothetical protein
MKRKGYTMRNWLRSRSEAGVKTFCGFSDRFINWTVNQVINGDSIRGHANVTQ